jgi:hypothetical protein
MILPNGKKDLKYKVWGKEIIQRQKEEIKTGKKRQTDRETDRQSDKEKENTEGKMEIPIQVKS